MRRRQRGHGGLEAAVEVGKGARNQELISKGTYLLVPTR